MKKVVKFAAVLLGSVVGGILVWRKVETERLRSDLWSEAERISAQQDSVAAATQAEDARAPRA